MVTDTTTTSLNGVVVDVETTCGIGVYVRTTEAGSESDLTSVCESGMWICESSPEENPDQAESG